MPDQGRRSGEVTRAAGPDCSPGSTPWPLRCPIGTAPWCCSPFFGRLRWGELAALRRSDIDFQARTVRISRQLGEQRGGGFTFGPPKSDAGYRTVAIPAVITPDFASHIVTFAAPGDDGLVSTSSEGKPLRPGNFCRRVWHPALRAAGLPAIHLHDLRHTGNQFAADEGANPRELMDRMGHSTTRAAMAYLHGSDERQQVIDYIMFRYLLCGSSRPSRNVVSSSAAGYRALSRCA